jgi:hypothetical protein
VVAAPILLLLATITGAEQVFTVSRAPLADVEQETLLAQATEVFPGAYVSPHGEAIVKRISSLIGRVDEVDRATLVEAKVGVGFDRSITAWRANASADAVALAVRYHRDRLLQLNMQFANDYGGAEPLDPADFEALTIARCLRAGDGRWACREDLLAAVAKAHSLALPSNPAGRDAIVEKLLERVLAQR